VPGAAFQLQWGVYPAEFCAPAVAIAAAFRKLRRLIWFCGYLFYTPMSGKNTVIAAAIIIQEIFNIL